MKTIDLGARWARLFKEHNRAMIGPGIVAWIVMIGVPLSVHFLPASSATVIATVLAVAGMGIGFHSGELEQAHKNNCDDLQQLHEWLYDHSAPTEDPATIRLDDQP